MSDKWWREKATLDDALTHGLKENEFHHVREVLGRDISRLELGICSALFSEHCSYKSTKVHLRNLPTEGPRVIQGPGENAGVVDIGDGEAVVFKVESHNHPTFIEPFQGAATGVGGILRDVFTMGARPIALLNSLRFGKSSLPKTRYLLSRAVQGIGSYGNCMGVPTVGGELFFHESYDGNCLVNAFCLGLVKTDELFYGHAAGVGNSIFYVGSKTGRDGIHGATMASESFDESSASKRPTVQVGDPFQEKLLLEACLEVMRSGAVVGIQDMGAAGLTSSTFEMADRAGTGLLIDLSLVPQREEGMTPYELMLSESQERMLVVIEAGKEAIVTEIFHRWGLDAVRIGEVVDSNTVDLVWNGEVVSSLPPALLTSSVPNYRWPERRPEWAIERKELDLKEIQDISDLGEAWATLVTNPNGCSRHEVYQQYDSTVRSNTVIHPGGDSAVLRVKRPAGTGPEKGIAMALDCNSRYCALDPRDGAALAVIEGVRNLACVGAEAIGLSDCLNFGSPEREEGMWQIAEGIRGLSDACRALKVPVVSGNVSLYNETNGKGILPTPLVALVGLIEDVSKTVGSHFLREGDKILLLGETDPAELGATRFLAEVLLRERGAPPRIDYERELRHAECVRRMIGAGLLRSCHDLSDGGLAVALAESCFTLDRAIGAKLTLDQPKGPAEGYLFGETQGRYLISCDPAREREIRDAAAAAGVAVTGYGEVGGTELAIEPYVRVDVAKLYEGWKTGLGGVFL